MTATSGMENAVGSGKVSTKEDRLHRGRKVTSAFLMQGWGQFLNQVLLILLLLIFHHGDGNPPYSQLSAQWTFRISFAIPAFGTLLLVYYRAYKMKAASKQLILAKKKQKVTGYDLQSLHLTFTYFGFRVLATAGGWFMNDVFFYGNKLFQSRFIAVLLPGNKSVMVGWLYNLLNVGVSLCGYYMASFLMDNKLCKFQRSPKTRSPPSLTHKQMAANGCRRSVSVPISFSLRFRPSSTITIAALPAFTLSRPCTSFPHSSISLAPTRPPSLWLRKCTRRRSAQPPMDFLQLLASWEPS